MKKRIFKLGLVAAVFALMVTGSILLSGYTKPPPQMQATNEYVGIVPTSTQTIPINSSNVFRGVPASAHSPAWFGSREGYTVAINSTINATTAGVTAIYAFRNRQQRGFWQSVNPGNWGRPQEYRFYDMAGRLINNRYIVHSNQTNITAIVTSVGRVVIHFATACIRCPIQGRIPCHVVYTDSAQTT